MRLRRSDPNRPGYTRRRRGRGFSYHDLDGAPAVAKASYVYPRVVDLYHAGETIAPALMTMPDSADGLVAREQAEQAVLALLSGDSG